MENQQIYSAHHELKNFLSAIPTRGPITDQGLRTQFNRLVEELARLVRKEADNYLLPSTGRVEGQAFWARGKALLGYSCAQFHVDNPQDLQAMGVSAGHGGEAIRLSQVQNNTQEMQVYIALRTDIVEQLTRAEAEFGDSTPERNFIDRAKEAVKSAGSVMEVIGGLMTTAAQLGLGPEQVRRILGM